MRWALLSALLLAVSPCVAGELESFEESATTGEDATPWIHRDRNSGSELGFASSDDLIDDSCRTLWLCILQITIQVGTQPTLEYAPDRLPGHPTIPTVRVDGGYQRVVGNVDAWSSRGEIGWSLFGAAYEYMEFHEHDADDRLVSWYWEGLYRTAPGPSFKLDFAAGYRGFKRDGNFGGAQTGASLGVYPLEGIGVEADFRWGSIGERILSDYHGRLLLNTPRLPGIFLRLGYRGVRVGDTTLHGPEAGVTFVY